MVGFVGKSVRADRSSVLANAVIFILVQRPTMTQRNASKGAFFFGPGAAAIVFSVKYRGR